MRPQRGLLSLRKEHLGGTGGKRQLFEVTKCEVGVVEIQCLCYYSVHFPEFYFTLKTREEKASGAQERCSRDYCASLLGRDRDHLHHCLCDDKRGSQPRGSHANCTGCPNRVSNKWDQELNRHFNKNSTHNNGSMWLH